MMKKILIAGTVLLVAAAILTLGCERKIINEGGVAGPIASYVGSATCGNSGCHEDIYESFVKTGHPFKLNTAFDAQKAGYYPFGDLPGPPDIINNAWSAVSYVIGGHRWKARFVDLDGYIVTGDAVQYNLETEEWVGYHSDEAIGTKPYDCGPCHTTGYSPVGNQDGLAGMVGTWDEGGIHCEECHGNGSFHVQDPRNVDMVIDRSMSMCGQCHVRGTPFSIPASGGFVKHHEQYNEILGSKHSSLECVQCHDVHKTLHPSEPNREEAIRVDCESCHWRDADSYVNSDIDHYGQGVECIGCHMPQAAKSAVGVTRILDGDVRSHIFTVNTRPDAQQFTEDGAFANPYLTLDYMCKKCHEDKDQAWMSTNALRMHFPDVSSAQCFDCHSGNGDLEAARGEWENSTHSSGSNIDYTNRGGGSDCTQCHNHQGFVEFVETGSVSAPFNIVTAVNCQTCHLAHESGTLELRTEDAFTLKNGEVYDYGKGNLCANCHHSRRDVGTYVVADVSTSSHWGPHHGPQGDLFAGTGGYIFEGFEYMPPASDHSTDIENSCVSCHMSDPRIHEGYKVGGHSVNMHDEESGYSLAPLCEDCHEDAESFDFLAEEDYDGDGTIEGNQTEFEGLVDDLRTLLVDGGYVDDEDHPISQTIADVNVAGALYNFRAVLEDRSKGVHNFQYMLVLLRGAIDYMEGDALVSK
jgi:Outer membrane cytochrome MtrC/MtrF-like, domains II/IV/Cytochrome c554 and c-prime